MFDHVKQTKLRHVKNQMANFKNLIPYVETSLSADQKSYKNHDDPKHLSSYCACKLQKMGENLLISQVSLPFEASFKG